MLKSFGIFLIFSLVATALAEDDDYESYSSIFEPVDDRIVNGVSIQINNRKFQVIMLVPNNYFGGSIIHPKWILTAAHCTVLYVESDIKVRAGVSYRTHFGVDRYVEKIHQHPDYDNKTLVYDISLLELKNQLPLNSKVGTIGLWTVVPPAGSDVGVSGFGRTTYKGSESDGLLYADIKIVTWEECVAAYGAKLIEDTQICASAPGTDSCAGDSGGPLTFEDKLLALVSYGKGCATEGYPGVYTSVPYFYPWIVGIVDLLNI